MSENINNEEIKAYINGLENTIAHYVSDNAKLHHMMNDLIWAVVTCRCTGDSAKCSKRIDAIVEEYKKNFMQDEPTY